MTQRTAFIRPVLKREAYPQLSLRPLRQAEWVDTNGALSLFERDPLTGDAVEVPADADSTGVELWEGEAMVDGYRFMGHGHLARAVKCAREWEERRGWAR